jgi:succinylarginine dihydrolase
MVLPNILYKPNKILARVQMDPLFVVAPPMRHSQYVLINQLICITNNDCLILHHKAFLTDYISRSTKICAPSFVRIPVQIKIFPNCRCAAVSRWSTNKNFS